MDTEELAELTFQGDRMRPFAVGILGTMALCLGFDQSMAQSEKTTRALPKVDQSAPEKIETATLALG